MNGRYRRSHRTVWLWLTLVTLVIAVRLVVDGVAERAPESLNAGWHAVSRVVDGDTLLLNSRARVRLQGIDTPETVRENHPVEPWGNEATRFTEVFVQQAGGRVRLTFGDERRDRYDRHLAFVWDDERMLNAELVRAGLARARLEYRYSGRMKSALAQAQREAQDAQRGIWQRP